MPPYLFPDVDVSLFARLPALKVVQMLTAGTEHVVGRVPDGVLLCSGRGIHDASTAELALTLTLASLRGIVEFERARRRASLGVAVAPGAGRQARADRGLRQHRRRDRGPPRALRVRGGPSGAPGSGRRARRRGAAAAAAGGRRRHRSSCPARRRRAGWSMPGSWRRMKEGALLVNVGRGSVVDTDALVAALHDGRVHAALDVTDPEPLPRTTRSGGAPNLVLSPHTGGPARRSGHARTGWCAPSSERYVAGQPLENVVERATD